MVSPRMRSARTAAVFLALVGAMAAGCSGNPNDDQNIEADLAAIERTNQLTLQALNEGNLELLNEMTAENHIMMIPGRPELRGREAVVEANANLISSWNIVERWTPLETVVSGAFAWQRGEFDINMTAKRDGVEPIVSVGKYLHIYERQDDGSWLMIRDMFSDNGGTVAAAELTGDWVIDASLGDIAIQVNCRLMQTSDELTGTCTPVMENPETSALTGRLDGNNVQWSYDVFFNGSPGHVAFSGEIESDSIITGTLDLSGTPTQFTATRQRSE